jgi:hypothetical protein
MSTGKKVRKIVGEISKDILFLQPEFNDALIGTARACGKTDVAAYDLTKCMNIMIEKHGVTEMEALEQVKNSIDDAPYGTHKPIFINDFRGAKDVEKIISNISEEKIKEDTVQTLIDTLPPLKGKKSTSAGELEKDQQSTNAKEDGD